jgi:hypothetical protein
MPKKKDDAENEEGSPGREYLYPGIPTEEPIDVAWQEKHNPMWKHSEKPPAHVLITRDKKGNEVQTVVGDPDLLPDVVLATLPAPEGDVQEGQAATEKKATSDSTPHPTATAKAAPPKGAKEAK